VNHAEPPIGTNETRGTRRRSLIPPALFLLTTLAIAGCGTVSSSSDKTTHRVVASLGQPIATVATPATSSAPTPTPSTSPTTAARPESIRLPPPPTPTAPRSRAILDVATRFANAYLLYQIGRAPRTVKQTIRSTCTQSFALLLLSQPVNVPSADRSSVAGEPSAVASVTYTGPASLGPGPPVQIVVARYHAIAHPDNAEQLTIELTAADAGWLVTSLR
jgi:hypothetical protein